MSRVTVDDIREIAIVVEESMRGVAIVRREERHGTQFIIHQPSCADRDQYLFFAISIFGRNDALVKNVRIGCFFRDRQSWIRLWQIQESPNSCKRIVPHLTRFIANPVGYVIAEHHKYAFPRLRDYFAQKLSESTSKEDFLEKLGHVWYQAIRWYRVPVFERCMLNIIRAGVPFGIGIDEIDALHEKLVRAIKAGNALI